MFFNFCLYFYLNYYFFLDLLGNEKKKVMYGKTEIMSYVPNAFREKKNQVKKSCTKTLKN